MLLLQQAHALPHPVLTVLEKGWQEDAQKWDESWGRCARILEEHQKVFSTAGLSTSEWSCRQEETASVLFFSSQRWSREAEEMVCGLLIPCTLQEPKARKPQIPGKTIL